MSAPTAVPTNTAPPRKRRRWPWIVGGTLAVLVVIGIAAPATPTTSTPAGSSVSALPVLDNAAGDVTISQCTPSGALGMAQVTTQVHNSTTSAQSYMITVSLNDAAGNRVAEANGAVNSLAPGQSAHVDLLGAQAPGATACTVASVTRIPV
jgi:hypothetical protein